MESRNRGRALGVALIGTALLSGQAWAAPLHLSEGTEVPVRIEDSLSSKSNTEGDRFTISLADEIRLADGTIIPAGFRGVGEVTSAEKNGMMGKAGTLNVRFDYLKIGDTRVRLRGSKGKEGDAAIGSTIALTVLFGPIGLIKKGKNVEIKKGQEITAYVDEDTDLTGPLPPPPPRAD